MLLKNNAKQLLVPYIIFNLLTLVILPAMLMNIILWWISFDNLFTSWGQWASVIISLLLTWGAFLVILYLIVLIPFQIWMLLSIKQALAEKEVTFMDNVKSCFSKILKYMTLYWYMFAYTLLIPALIFIVGGFLMIWGMLVDGSFSGVLNKISGIFIFISVILWLYFAIYRGVKATFALVSAVDKETISKETFYDSLRLSDGKWWRVLWNFFAVGIIGGLLVWLVSWLGNAIAFSWTDFSNLTNLDQEESSIQDALNAFTDFSLLAFLNQGFQNILGTILGVYISIFSYIFYRRLVDESTHGEVPVEKVVIQEKSEL